MLPFLVPCCCGNVWGRFCSRQELDQSPPHQQIPSHQSHPQNCPIWLHFHLIYSCLFIYSKLAVNKSTTASVCGSTPQPVMTEYIPFSSSPPAHPLPSTIRGQRMKTDWKAMTGRLPAGLYHYTRCVFRPSAPIAPLNAENKQENKLAKLCRDVVQHHCGVFFFFKPQIHQR